MTTLTTITFLTEDRDAVDWDMVKAAAERGARWERGTAKIEVRAPERDGTKHYGLVIADSNDKPYIVIGVLKRPGSDEIEFHS